MADGDFVSMVENVDHEIEPGVRVKMETHEPGSDNHSEHNGASSSEPVKEHNPSTGPRLSDLRIGVEEKSQMLTSAWTELSNILGQYKAELYSRDDSTQKYEHTNDVCLLKSELVDKDSEIAHLRMQLGEVQNQCEQIQRHNEQCQMDLSVKDSLLKKYQDDLLQKEAALMTSQTKISRLENRLRMLESRAGAQVERKVVKPVGSPRMSPLARLSRGGLVTRPMLGRMMPGLSPARKRPSLPITPIRSPSASRSTPAKQETQPVVCIEVDDDEIRQEVDLVSQQSLQQEASIGLYGGELYDSATTEATDVGSLPGTSEPQPGTSSASPRQDMLNRPMMVQEEYVSDQDTSLKPQDWPEAYERQQVPTQMQQPQTTNKIAAGALPRATHLVRTPTSKRRNKAQPVLVYSDSDDSPSKRKAHEYDRDLRDQIAQMAIQIGDRATARHYSDLLGHMIHYWTVYNFKKSYLRRMNHTISTQPRPKGRKKKSEINENYGTLYLPESSDGTVPSMAAISYGQVSSDIPSAPLDVTANVKHPQVQDLKMSESETNRRKQASPLRVAAYAVKEEVYDDHGE